MTEPTKQERELEALKALYFARHCIENAGNAMIGAAQLLNSPRPSNAMKLLQRGWSKVDESLGRKIPEDSHNLFLMQMTEDHANTEEESDGGSGGGDSGGEGASEGGDERTPDGVDPAGPDEGGGDGCLDTAEDSGGEDR